MARQSGWLESLPRIVEPRAEAGVLLLLMLNFDFFESSSHAVLYEFGEARIPEVVLSILPLELHSVVLWDFDRQTSGHVTKSAALYISCYLVLDERRQVVFGEFVGIR
jgi:hypothetical protein